MTLVEELEAVEAEVAAEAEWWTDEILVAATAAAEAIEREEERVGCYL